MPRWRVCRSQDRDLSPNYDLFRARRIQQFTSDFRGFIFSEEQPASVSLGICVPIGWPTTWRGSISSKKNTNSGLNSFHKRGQQVYVANLYIQDFLTKGYTTEFSFHYNRDDASIHYDDNDFWCVQRRWERWSTERSGPQHPRLLLGGPATATWDRQRQQRFYQALGHG